MRNKRIQRRRKVATPKAVSGYILPDPFSRLNPSLVREEAALADACSCCLDREAHLEYSRLERAYLNEFEDYRRSMRDDLEIRYQDPKLLCDTGFCFCTDCAESREHAGEDYDAWRRAFPSLPWDGP